MNETERLAKMLAEEGAIPEFELTNAAVELRRLSAINAKLTEVNVELVQALSDAMPCLRIYGLGGVDGRAQAALEKAKQCL